MPPDFWPHVCPGCAKEWNGNGTEPAFCVRCGYNQPPLLANLSDELMAFLGDDVKAKMGLNLPEKVKALLAPYRPILEAFGRSPKPVIGPDGLTINCPKCGRRVRVAKPSSGQGADGAAIACNVLHGGCGYILILAVEVGGPGAG